LTNYYFKSVTMITYSVLNALYFLGQRSQLMANRCSDAKSQPRIPIMTSFSLNLSLSFHLPFLSFGIISWNYKFWLHSILSFRRTLLQRVSLKFEKKGFAKYAIHLLQNQTGPNTRPQRSIRQVCMYLEQD